MEKLDTAESFKAAVLDTSKVVLLLVFSTNDEASTSAVREAMRAFLTSQVRAHAATVRLAEWDCSAPSMDAARASLDVVEPIELVALRSGQVVDRLRGEAAIQSTMPTMMERIGSFVQQKVSRVEAVAGGQQQQKVSVDVAKLLAMGQDLMRKAQAAYAEKFFLKAVGVLDAVQKEAGDDEDVRASLALSIAWALLAQLAQAKEVHHNSLAKRLQQNEMFLPWRDEPLSDVSRAITAWNLMRMAPASWDPATCSVAKLTAVLQSDPQKHHQRAQLVVTYFLSGDLERCLTEALKLHVLQQDFGRYALTEVQAFIGKEHALNQMLGFNAQLA
jgi:hypothetical protein